MEGMCPATGKVQYANGAKAAKAKKALRTRRNAAPQDGLSVYRCDACGHFHLGRPGKFQHPRNRRHYSASASR